MVVASGGRVGTNSTKRPESTSVPADVSSVVPAAGISAVEGSNVGPTAAAVPLPPTGRGRRKKPENLFALTAAAGSAAAAVVAAGLLTSAFVGLLLTPRGINSLRPEDAGALTGVATVSTGVRGISLAAASAGGRVAAASSFFLLRGRKRCRPPSSPLSPNFCGFRFGLGGFRDLEVCCQFQ